MSFDNKDNEYNDSFKHFFNINNDDIPFYLNNYNFFKNFQGPFYDKYIVTPKDSREEILPFFVMTLLEEINNNDDIEMENIRHDSPLYTLFEKLNISYRHFFKNTYQLISLNRNQSWISDFKHGKIKFSSSNYHKFIGTIFDNKSLKYLENIPVFVKIKENFRMSNYLENCYNPKTDLKKKRKLDYDLRNTMNPSYIEEFSLLATNWLLERNICPHFSRVYSTFQSNVNNFVYNFNHEYTEYNMQKNKKFLVGLREKRYSLIFEEDDDSDTEYSKSTLCKDELNDHRIHDNDFYNDNEIEKNLKMEGSISCSDDNCYLKIENKLLSNLAKRKIILQKMTYSKKYENDSDSESDSQCNDSIDDYYSDSDFSSKNEISIYKNNNEYSSTLSSDSSSDSLSDCSDDLIRYFEQNSLDLEEDDLIEMDEKKSEEEDMEQNNFNDNDIQKMDCSDDFVEKRISTQENNTIEYDIIKNVVLNKNNEEDSIELPSMNNRNVSLICKDIPATVYVFEMHEKTFGEYFSQKFTKLRILAENHLRSNYKLQKMVTLWKFKRYLKEIDKELDSFLCQITMTLICMQFYLNLFHNDFYFNNVMLDSTDEEYLFYYIQGQGVYRVPTYGKIIKIIDYGRSTLVYNNVLLMSNEFRKNNGELGGFYTYPYKYPFFAEEMEFTENTKIIKNRQDLDSCLLKIYKNNKNNNNESFKNEHQLTRLNPSYDLCHFAVAMIVHMYEIEIENNCNYEIQNDKLYFKNKFNYLRENIIEIRKHLLFKKYSKIYNMLDEWTKENDNRKRAYRINGYDLYPHIAKNVTKCIPIHQINKYFNQYKIETSDIPLNKYVYPITT